MAPYFFRWTQVQELRRDGNRKSNGGMNLAAFRHVMLRVFGIDDINDFILQDRNSHNIDANVNCSHFPDMLIFAGSRKADSTL